MKLGKDDPSDSLAEYDTMEVVQVKHTVYSGIVIYKAENLIV